MGGGDRIRDGNAAASRAGLAAALRGAREYTLRLYAHLAPAQREVPRLAIVNPPAWELGHVGWFQEFWCRRWSRDDPRGTRVPPRLRDADAWFDSRHVPHDVRWDLPLPSWEAIHAYLAATLADTLEALAAARDDDLPTFALALLHEDMHGEAMLMTLHTLALPAPPGVTPVADATGVDASGDDVAVEGGRFTVGTPVDARRLYVWDNERDAHAVDLRPFAIARAPVTNAAFAAFVDDGGYDDDRWWRGEARTWREGTARGHPADWRRAQSTSGWEERRFDRWQPLDPGQGVRHVNAFEAQAWCRWAGRRLPTEVEWERAAGLGVIGAHGVTWEWTASPFRAYPGFVPGPYAEYSAPWFGDHRTLRGGSWATRPRLTHPAFRNFYRPDRHDPFVGFRTGPTGDRPVARRGTANVAKTAPPG